MSQQDRSKWNLRYAEDSYRKGNPVTSLKNWTAKIAPGKALDIACGTGRNAIYLAQAGFEVDAIDISREGLNKAQQNAEKLGLDINWIEHDLDQSYRFGTDYNLIIVMWYVNLPLITQLCNSLVTGGYLLCEEHLKTDHKVMGPTNYQYRVGSGELRKTVSKLDVLKYEESIETSEEGEQIASARVLARN